MIHVPDALTHVLIAYALALALSLRYEWITPQLTTVAMAGAMIPDLSKFRRLVSGEAVEAVIGVPFAWQTFHTAGGAIVVVLITSLMVRPEYRKAVTLLLALGIFSHFLLDMFLVPPDGTFPYLWPFTNASIALPGFYKSGDPWTVPVVVLSALVVRSAVQKWSLKKATQ